MDRHQLDGRNAQRLQVGNLVDDAQVSARVLDAAGRMLGKAADVHFVNHGVSRQLVPQMPVAFPIETVVDHHALGRTDEPVVRRQEAAGQGLRIRIDQARRYGRTAGPAPDRTARRPESGKAVRRPRPAQRRSKYRPSDRWLAVEANDFGTVPDRLRRRTARAALPWRSD